MIDARKLLWRLGICTSCLRHLSRHCLRCWACDAERHVCQRTG